MKKALAGLYEALVFKHPRVLTLGLLLLLVAAGFFAAQFRMDASADALVLENDADLRYYREISAKYGSEDFLFIAYRPLNGDLLSDETTQDLAALRDELSDAVPTLSQVFTLLDAPLIDSPRLGLSDLTKGVRTVLSPETDKELARKELQSGVLYGENLVSTDGSVTALLLTFERDARFYELLNQRNNLRLIKLDGELTKEESEELASVSQTFTEYQTAFNNQRTEHIRIIREVMAKHDDKAELFLGGPSMIASDMVDFIRKDLLIFGLGILLLLVVTLAVIFRKTRWVILPLIACSVTALATTGLLGLLDWPVTVISSNYISLLLIITLSMNIHLIVRYRLLQAENPQWSSHDLVLETMRQMGMPCFYMTITTIVAFGSLIVSGIRPVIDFGYMMMCGVALAFVVSFLVLPLGLRLLKPTPAANVHDNTEAVTVALGRFTLNNGGLVLVFFALAALMTAWGITKLEVENRFIDYFKSDTEIHQGMLVIDQKLGGTTPLEVVIDANADFFTQEIVEEEDEDLAIFGDDFDEDTNVDELETNDLGDDEDWLAELEAEDEESTEEAPNYWYNSHMLGRLEQVHDYLESLPEVGKVTSLATAVKMVRMVNNDDPLGDFELAIMRKNMPEVMRKTLVAPYLSEDANQVRLVMRVIDSNKELRRGELIERIRTDIINDYGFEEEQVNMTGMLVLYNNMLQSLFSSQIMTLGAVMAAILVMFIVLFRSLFVSIVTIIPNILAATAILGVIGWIGIPLDLMTITIAAITVGIAVDDAIHYIYHVQHELEQNGGDYTQAILQGHASVGKAMYYTTLTIIMGFSVLVMSNFIPSIYFGLLAGLAMLVALVCNLVLLPRLLMLFKPFNKW